MKRLLLLAFLITTGSACSDDYQTDEPIQTVHASVEEASFEGGADWPQWRGLQRDGLSPETGLALLWGESGPRELWRNDVGEGYSGITVSGRHVCTLDQTDAEYVVCFDSRSGSELWRHRLDSRYRDSQGNGPRGAATIDNGVLFAVGAQGQLHAVTLSTGDPLWTVDLPRRFGASVPTWGYATSPLVDNDLVLVQPGGSGDGAVAALNRETGDTVWSAFDDGPGYSSPMAGEFGGIRQILFFTSGNLISVRRDDGAVLWQHRWETSYDVNAATPILIDPQRVFISSGYGVGGSVLEVSASGVRPIWKNREMKNHFNSSVLYQGYLYGFDNGTLKCLDARNGERMWRQRGFGKGSLIIADGHLIVLGERGTLAVAEATSTGYVEKARAQVLKGKCWTSPTLSHGKLYLRNQSQMVALDLASTG